MVENRNSAPNRPDEPDVFDNENFDADESSADYDAEETNAKPGSVEDFTDPNAFEEIE